nr:hypothetical protein [Tanacetum cinerariifolium]
MDIFETPPSTVITTSPPVLPIEDLEESIIMRNEELNTIFKKESDEFIKSSVEDLVPIPSESEDTSGSESVCILPSRDDFSPIDVPEEKAVTFSNPLFNSNDYFISSDDGFNVYPNILNKSPMEICSSTRFTPNIIMIWVESVGSSFPRVILIGSISVEILVAPEVGAAAVASPVGVLELDIHSSSKADPSKSSPPPISVAPMVSPFLCSDDSESDTEIPERHVSLTPHDAMLTRWSSRVASRSLSPITSTPEIPTAPILPAPSAIVAPSSEFPLAPIVALLGICRQRAILIQTEKDIPIALSYTSYHLDHFTSGSSLSHLSDHSSSGHSISSHSLPGHASPDSIVADSSTPPRFVHPRLLGLHGVATPISVGGLPHYLPCIHRQLGILLSSHLLGHLARDVEQTDREAMINSIKNGDQPLPRVTQVSIAGTSSTEQPSLKDKSMCNKTAKDLWDALARHMLGSEYGEQDRKAAVLYEYKTFKATEEELLLDTYIRYLQ